MLTLRIHPEDTAGPWTWIGRRWQSGRSWIEPYEHPALQRCDPDANSTAMVVRERSPHGDRTPHSDAWPGDFVTVQPTDDGVWLQAGARGVAPLYLVERHGILHGSWDIAVLRPHLGAARPVPREIARLLGMRFRYCQETLWEGLYRLTERGVALFNSAGLRLRYPLPAAHSVARPLVEDADVLAGYEHLLAHAVSQHVYDPDTSAVELSGGLDSANVAATLGALHPGQVAASAMLLIGAAGDQQRDRRRQMINRFGLGASITTAMTDHLPLGPTCRRSTGAPITPYSDPYDRARSVLLAELAERGVRTVFSGVGGDEMVAMTSAEQPGKEAFGVGLAVMPWIGRRTREILDVTEQGIAPATIVNEMTLISQASAAPAMLHARLWPVHPLADPDLIRFGEWLPSECRTRKRLHRDRLVRLGCPPELVNPALPENFAPVMEQAVRQHGLSYLRSMLTSGAMLLDEGYIDPDGLAATVQRLTDNPFAPRDTEVYAVIAVEAALRAFADSPAAATAGAPGPV